MYQINGLTLNEVYSRIRNIASQLEAQAGDARYIVYLISDPTVADPLGLRSSLPIYIGESGQFAYRADNHMREAYKGRGAESSIKRRIGEIGEAGWLPQIEILERLHTRADSLRKETEWAQRFLRQGYHLYNQWTEQRQIVSREEQDRWAKQRLWFLTIAEAAEAGLQVVFECPQLDFIERINPGDHIDLQQVRQPLRDLKALRKRCPRCNARLDVTPHC
jgi:hypothetical protein